MSKEKQDYKLGDLMMIQEYTWEYVGIVCGVSDRKIAVELSVSKADYYDQDRTKMDAQQSGLVSPDYVSKYTDRYGWADREICDEGKRLKIIPREKLIEELSNDIC